ncbi:MAG: hypothetical protein KF773_32335 [Deltaproteobacteria bacterium]|nr:hypothetical protein [Deltaproteobacteria bacterium]
MFARVAVAAVLVGGCYTGSQTPPANTQAAADPTAVTPRIRITTPGPDDGDMGRRLEGYPPFEYDHLPAVSVDRTKVAVVEERDGWGHTATPGVRILDVASGKTVTWLPVVGGDRWPDDAAVGRSRAAIEELVAAANAVLARTSWHPLATPGEPTTTGEDADRIVAWTLGPHTVTMTYAPDDPYAEDPRSLPSTIVITDSAGRQVTRVDDVRNRWRHTARCATPSFSLAAVHPASHILVFHQKLGLTSHDCDGVNVPDDWRILRF